MRIGLLTLPFHYNYGGILQAFALSQILKGLGHEVVLVRYDFRNSIKRRIIKFIQKILFKTLKIDCGVKDTKDIKFICHNIIPFVESNFKNQTKLCVSKRQLKKITDEYGFDAYIVGSDQVWNKEFTGNNVPVYFLNFCSDVQSIKKIAYGASYGRSEWEFSKFETYRLIKLARKFNAISVRENDAVELCRKFLNTPVRQVLDPTLLLDVSIYLNLIDVKRAPFSSRRLVSYFLDENPVKSSMTTQLAYNLNLKLVNATPKFKASRKFYENYPNECVWMSVEDWLKMLYTAELVLTDSFHGCVFSIIFHRPFLVFANEKRGTSRITSLLKQLGLENCLIKGKLDVEYVKQINWRDIDERILEMRQQSLSFICQNLLYNE